VKRLTRGGAARSYVEVLKGVTAMTHNGWTAKNLILITAIVSLACIAAVVGIGLVYPEPVSSAALGPDWQCSRLAFVWTTCTRLTQARVARERPATEPKCPRRRT
jgi:hypothetical protein